MKTRTKSLILIPLVALLLCACETKDVDTSKEDSEVETTTSGDTSEGGSQTEDGSSGVPSVEPTTTNQIYYWLPVASQFDTGSNNTLNAGTLTHNGLTWSYTAISTYFGDDTDNNPSKGLHIGSKTKPETGGWTLSTDFGETITLTSITLVLSVGSSGSSTYTIKADNEVVSTDKFTNTSPQAYEFSELEYECSSLSINIVASSSAFYLQSIMFGIVTDVDSSLSLSSDGEQGTWGAGFKPQDRIYTVTSDLDSLYAPITDSMSGETLRNSLRTITSVKTQYTYGDLRNNLLYTDEDPSNPGYLYGAYDGELIYADWDYGASWNREHTWPCAHMSGVNDKARPDNSDKGAYTDMHNIRVCTPSTNSDKADYYVGNQGQSNCYFVNVGEGDHRGDTARILLYMYTEYDGLVLSDIQGTNTNVTYGYLSTILEWNKEDPVDDFERQRNNRIEEYQGNRNPFIDHPEYAERLFN